MRTFFWLGCLSYLIIGLSHVVIGSILPELLLHYGKDYSDGGLLVALQFAGFLTGVLLGPWFSGRMGRRGALLLALFCLGAAEIVFFTLPGWPLLLINAPAAGFGFGMIETLIGALVLGQPVEESRKTAMMVRLEVFFGVGALIMPLLASVYISVEWWRGAFLSLSLLVGAAFALWLLLPMGELAGTMGRTAPAPGALSLPDSKKPRGEAYLRSGTMLLFLLIFGVYVGAEMSVANFLPSILMENGGVSAEVGALGVSFFWAAMSAGRLVAARAAGWTGHPGYLMLGAGGASLVLLLFALTSSPAVSFLLVVLLGLFLSGMFAIALVYANGFFPGAEERTTSVLIAAGGVGGALLPLLTGWCMDRLSPSMTLTVLVGVCLVLLVLIYTVSKRRPQNAAAEATAS